MGVVADAITGSVGALMDIGNFVSDQVYAKKDREFRDKQYQDQLAQQQFQNQFQQEQFDYLKEQDLLKQQREDTAIQRQVKDYIDAGLSPVLASGGSGAMSNAGGSSVSSPSSALGSASAFGGLVPHASASNTTSLLQTSLNAENLSVERYKKLSEAVDVVSKWDADDTTKKGFIKKMTSGLVDIDKFERYNIEMDQLNLKTDSLKKSIEGLDKDNAIKQTDVLLNDMYVEALDKLPQSKREQLEKLWTDSIGAKLRSGVIDNIQKCMEIADIGLNLLSSYIPFYKKGGRK
ncbi:minor capsid protein [Capybara microvirus Cap1_SP_161]|nr:minor capsid protein [Capybara microvirus Cap1_SP_161]